MKYGFDQSVLFVCLGNICRSPVAETILMKLTQESQLKDKVFIDSAGTSGYHEGELADSRMREACRMKGYQILSRSRQFRVEDFNEFDFIIVMDDSNLNEIEKIKPKNPKAQVLKMLDYHQGLKGENVPDPYYGGVSGFFDVIKMLEESCHNLLKDLCNNFSSKEK